MGTEGFPDNVSLSWIRTRGTEGLFDVLHLQFFELDPLEELEAVLATCREKGLGIVVTIHDLQPMFSDFATFKNRVEKAAGYASCVVTLTPGARDALARGFGLDSSKLRVIPHGNVLDLGSSYWQRGRRTGRVVTFGVYGSLRPNRNVASLLDQWRRFSPGRDVRLKLLLRATADRSSTGKLAELEALLTTLRDSSVEPHVFRRARPTDDQVVEFLRGCDVLVLPYSWGSHSGQLELGLDLDLTIVAPEVGFYREQYDSKAGLVPEPVWFSWAPQGGQLDLREALRDAEERARRRRPAALTHLRAFRTAERHFIREEHLRSYLDHRASLRGL